MSATVSAERPAPQIRLASLIEDDLRRSGAPPLAELAHGPLTRPEALRETDRLLERLRAAGLGEGDRIALFVRDERQLILLVVAALRSGIGFVVGDPRATFDEARRLVEVCRPAAVIADKAVLSDAGLESSALGAQVLDIGAEWDRVTPSQPRSTGTALLIFTSGTTSSAKAVELTYDNLLAQFEIFAEVYGFRAGDRFLNLLPPHHTDGLTRGPLAALRFGATLVRPTAFSLAAIPGLLNRIGPDGITHLIAVPAMLRLIGRAGWDQPDAFRTPAFRFILSSADTLDAALWTRTEERFGVPVVNAYGLSEAVCDALFAGPEDRDRVPGTIGRPVGLTAEVLNEDGTPVPPGETGELVLIGPTIMKGYFGAPDQTAQVLDGGRLRTGDLVRVNPEGLFEFKGRRKTAIVSAGVTIYPEGVTEVLLTMPEVAEAFAFGRPDPVRNERLVAAVVPAAGVALSDHQVLAFCRERLAPERVPVEVLIVEKLPRGPSGKVVLAELDDLLAPPPAPEPDSLTVYDVAARCLGCPPGDLSAASTPFNTPGWDSLAHLTLITDIEESFGILFSATEIAEFGSLGDAEEIVRRARAETTGAAPDS